MDTKVHIQNSIFVTVGLIILTVLSKILTDSPHSLNTQSGVKLLSSALKWKNIASQDSLPFVKLQHLILASSYLSAARQISKDSELENITGADLLKFRKVLEQQSQSTIEALNSKCPKLRGKLHLLNTY
tara:strand:- start:472 stop:858 length:387 start_codon:yes stop_codon:yes gene_type:complete